MAGYTLPGDFIRRLAMDRGLQRACREKAEQVGARARQIDPDAQIRVTDHILNVNGLPRVVSFVENVAPDAAKREFGGAKQATYRPLGRAAAQFKE